MSAPKSANEVVSSLWFKYHSTLESTLMQDATALQIAMRNLLRDRYWLTDCRPLGPVAVKNVRVRMASRNARDVITQEEVDELLTPEFGFKKEVSADGELVGYHMPDLAEQRGGMLDAREVERAKKQVQRSKQVSTPHPAAAPAPKVAAAPVEDDYSRPTRGSGVVASGELMALAGGDDGDF